MGECSRERSVPIATSQTDGSLCSTADSKHPTVAPRHESHIYTESIKQVEESNRHTAENIASNTWQKVSLRTCSILAAEEKTCNIWSYRSNMRNVGKTGTYEVLKTCQDKNVVNPPLLTYLLTTGSPEISVLAADRSISHRDWSITDSEILKTVAKIAPEYWKELLSVPFGVVRMTQELYLVLDWDDAHQEAMVHTPSLVC